MNSYRDTLQKLYSVNQQRGVKFGLANMLELSNFFSHPERNYPTIHIAGSNGKGSVTTKIAKAYEFSGKRIGLYTSPHLSTYRERISINGVFIEPWEVEKTLNEIMTAAEENSIPATFFELTTLLAFRYFAEKNVDLAVIETGLGGRFDATNIVTPLLSIITSISLEHTEILGNSLEEIAYEKAGIIKPGVPVIVGPRVPIQPVSDIAGRLGSSYIQVEGNFSWFDEENNAIAKKALETLKLPEEFIEEGVKALPPCRMEIVKESPKVILDVAHNPDGLLHLFQAIQKKHPNRPFRVVCGFSRNKDIRSCLSVIAKYTNAIHFIEGMSPRAASIQELALVLAELGIVCETLRHDLSATMENALEIAAERGEFVVICGTFFIMNDVRKALGLHYPDDEIALQEIFNK